MKPALDMCPHCGQFSLETTMFDADVFFLPAHKFVNQTDRCRNCHAWRISNVNNGQWFGVETCSPFPH